MTKGEFHSFCKENNQTRITTGEFDDIKVNFENGEWVLVYAGIDGLAYQHSA